MKTIKVEFIIELEDNAGTNWLCAAIEDNLEKHEKIAEYSIEEIKNEKSI